MSGIVSVEGLFMEHPSFFFWGRRSGSLTPSLLVDSIMLVEDRSSSWENYFPFSPLDAGSIYHFVSVLGEELALKEADVITSSMFISLSHHH